MYYGELVTIKGTQTAYLYDSKDVDKKYPHPVKANSQANHVVTEFFSQEELDAFVTAKNLELKTKNTIYLVLKNADFTEGRGPMVPHRAFADELDAEKFISEQVGIYGSEQYREIRSGRNINDEVYAYVCWNGYSIKPIELE